MSYWRRLRIRKNNYKVPKRLSKGPAVTKAAISLHDLQPLVFFRFHCLDDLKALLRTPGGLALQSQLEKIKFKQIICESMGRFHFGRLVISSTFFSPNHVFDQFFRCNVELAFLSLVLFCVFPLIEPLLHKTNFNYGRSQHRSKSILGRRGS